MELLGAKPAQQAAVYFMLAILIGAILLCLPFSANGHPISFINALFTSTSAVCVTGLTVVDTGRDFSLFGQIIILILIQLGGLGIMTFTTVILISMGSRLSFQSRYGLSQSLDAGIRTHVNVLLKAVVITTLTVEGVGAILLFLRFHTQMPVGSAIYFSIFHAISAFCNAGFSLFSNSLEGFRGDIPVLLIFAFLIICGGLGFAVIREVYARLVKKEQRLSLHSKLCLSTTAILLVAGTIAILVAEYHNSFKHTGLGYDIVNAFFQSTTSRTAGFNALRQASLSNTTILITIILMFIGACPGSTGGGIKTTTVAVILHLVIDRFRGRRNVSIFKRTVSPDSISRALTVLLLALIAIVVIFAIFLFTEETPIGNRVSYGWFVEYLFEVFSAFGTVGLSMGVTSSLHNFGKVLIILLMFAGRVGLLTLAFAMARPKSKGEIVYREEEVLVG